MVKKSFVVAAVMAGLLGTAEASHADVKVVSRVSVDKVQASGSAPVSRTVTAYFKNNNARIESGTDNTVLLYDYAARTVSILNPAQKTYYVKPVPASGQSGSGQGRLSQFVSISVTGGIQPVPRTTTTTIAGVPTKPYSVRADVSAQPKSRAAGGVLSGGAASLHVEGQFQGAAASLVLPAVTAERLLSLTQQLLAQGWVAGPLASDFLQLKVVPMKATLVVTPSANLAAIAQKSSVPSGPTRISTEVLSLDEKTTLDSALFVIPAGYQKVDAPRKRAGDLGNAFGFGLR